MNNLDMIFPATCEFCGGPRGAILGMYDHTPLCAQVALSSIFLSRDGVLAQVKMLEQYVQDRITNLNPPRAWANEPVATPKPEPPKPEPPKPEPPKPEPPPGTPTMPMRIYVECRSCQQRSDTADRVTHCWSCLARLQYRGMPFIAKRPEYDPIPDPLPTYLICKQCNSPSDPADKVINCWHCRKELEYPAMPKVTKRPSAYVSTPPPPVDENPKSWNQYDNTNYGANDMSADLIRKPGDPFVPAATSRASRTMPPPSPTVDLSQLSEDDQAEFEGFTVIAKPRSRSEAARYEQSASSLQLEEILSEALRTEDEDFSDRDPEVEKELSKMKTLDRGTMGLRTSRGTPGWEHPGQS
jgi:hypothetical protein